MFLFPLLIGSFQRDFLPGAEKRVAPGRFWFHTKRHVLVAVFLELCHDSRSTKLRVGV